MFRVKVPLILTNAQVKKREDSAVIIQCAYRCHLARDKINCAYRAQNVKVFDDAENSYFYRNKVRPFIDEFRPKFLRRFDLPSPRKNGERGPEEYNAGSEDISNGYLVVVSNTDFHIGKWGEVSEAIGSDHEQLRYLLSHEFIGKYPPENTFIMKNASTNEFKEAMENLRKNARTRGFLTVYMATHMVTVVKGEKDNKKERGYFAFANSVWGSNEEIAESCISLSSFIGMLNKISCQRKTVLLNYAHQPKPRSFFPSSKMFYPTTNFLSTICEKAHCCVIGCCAIGETAKEYLKHSVHHVREHLDDTEGEIHVGFVNDSNSHRKQNFFQRHERAEVNYQKLLLELMKEWGSKPIPDIVKAPRPGQPIATWKRKIEGDYEIIMPDPRQRSNYNRRILLWKMRRGLAKPVNFVKKHYRAHLKHTFRSPCQLSITDSDYTVFGRSVINAVRGGACQPDRPHISCIDLFVYIHDYMQSIVNRMNLKNASEHNADGDTPAPATLYQTPVLFVPADDHDMIKNPVFFRVGPPAAPDRPYIIQLGDTSVLLEWYNPTFDGVPPSKYKVAMKNITRNFSEWRDVYYAGDITKTVFRVRNLPMGIACQFKVAGYNNGGWGDYSDPTTMVIPGEEHEVLPDWIRLKRLRMGGIHTLLDRLEKYPAYRDEHLVSMRMLIGIVQVEHGFKTVPIAIHVATLAMKALKRFDMDADIATQCFILMGWSLQGIKFERKVRQHLLYEGIVKIVERCIKYFRENQRLMGALDWLRGAMPKYLPPLPECDYTTLIPPEKDPNEEEEEEDEAALKAMEGEEDEDQEGDSGDDGEEAKEIDGEDDDIEEIVSRKVGATSGKVAPAAPSKTTGKKVFFEQKN